MYIQYTVLRFLGRKQNIRPYILVERTHSWTENIVTASYSLLYVQRFYAINQPVHRSAS